MITCDYCYALAVWSAETANGPRPMCQYHYDELSRARRAEGLSRISSVGLALLADSAARV